MLIIVSRERDVTFEPDCTEFDDSSIRAVGFDTKKEKLKQRSNLKFLEFFITKLMLYIFFLYKEKVTEFQLDLWNLQLTPVGSTCSSQVLLT